MTKGLYHNTLVDSRGLLSLYHTLYSIVDVGECFKKIFKESLNLCLGFLCEFIFRVRPDILDHEMHKPKDFQVIIIVDRLKKPQILIASESMSP